LGIKPYRALADDMQLTTQATSYAGGPVKKSVITNPGADFAKMSQTEKLARARERIRNS
jgi:hypothetical protein